MCPSELTNIAKFNSVTDYALSYKSGSRNQHSLFFQKELYFISFYFKSRETDKETGNFHPLVYSPNAHNAGMGQA